MDLFVIIECTVCGKLIFNGNVDIYFGLWEHWSGFSKAFAAIWCTSYGYKA